MQTNLTRSYAIKIFLTFIIIFIFGCTGSSSSKIIFTPYSHNFGEIGVGSDVNFTFTLKNNSGFDVTLLTFEFQGTDASEFSFVSGAVVNTVLVEKASHILEIKFSPTTVGIKKANIYITHNGIQQPLKANVSGEGKMMPVFSINPDTYNFNKVLIGQDVDVDFTITNTGLLDLVISDVQVTTTPPFSIQAGWTGSNITIAPAGTHVVAIRFNPPAAGVSTGTVTFTHNSNNSPTIVNIEGEGSNAVPQIDIAPTTHDFGTVTVGNTSVPVTFTITNTGTGQLDVSDISFTGTDPADFDKTATLPINIVASGTAQFTATFTPSSAGTKNAVMEITHNAAGSPLLVNVTGNGTTSSSPTVLLTENFDVGTGWSLASGPASMGVTWYIEDGSNGPHPNFPGNPNLTGGTGNFANADADLAAFFNGMAVTLDEYLISPVVDCSSYTSGTITLEFKGNFQAYEVNTFNDMAGVLAWDGATYQVLDDWTTDWNPAGETKRYDVSAYALGNVDFDFVFYYTGEDDWFFQVDDVKLTHTP